MYQNVLENFKSLRVDFSYEELPKLGVFEMAAPTEKGNQTKVYAMQKANTNLTTGTVLH